MKKLNRAERFLRYEFKYVVSRHMAADIEHMLKNFMYLDPFVEQCIGNRYFVRSLYFDDKIRSCYNDKVDGLLDRKKFRVRTYSDREDPDVPIFLEQKGRYNNFVYKNRLRLEGSDVTADTLRAYLESLGEGLDVMASEFIVDVFKKQISPVVLIDYQRRAYQSNFDYEFRLTFDSEICATVTPRLFPLSAASRRECLPGYVVMEAKFRRHIPPWFHRILTRFELHRRSISKYCTGMERTGLVESLED